MQYTLPLPARESLTAEDFLRTASNDDAVRLVLETPPTAWAGGSVLLITGPEGSGKTHLASIWSDRWRAVPPSSQALTALVNGTPDAPRALVLDDADHLAGQHTREEDLQHLYNAAKAAGVPFLLTARTPPALWGLGLADIASRLKSCPVVALHEPDDALMRGLLLKQFADRQLRLDEGVIDYLAKRLERTASAVRAAVALLDEKALAEGHKISIPFAQATLFSDD
jgi:chromosomal replication initiation ATPase DnaA